MAISQASPKVLIRLIGLGKAERICRCLSKNGRSTFERSEIGQAVEGAELSLILLDREPDHGFCNAVARARPPLDVEEGSALDPYSFL
jgi:hypothetical protein